VDANPALAQALRVQGIPAVKAVFQGQLIGEFTGALPESQVRQFVSALVEATGGAAAGAPAAAGASEAELPEAEDPRFAAAEEAITQGDLDGAARRYQAILVAEPLNEDAAAALRQVELLRRVQAAPTDAIARADAAPDDVGAQLAAADAALAQGDVEAAFGRVLDVIGRTSGPGRDRARSRLVELFGVVGVDDPRVGEARRRLTQLLF
jgi:putative thioredoxin